MTFRVRVATRDDVGAIAKLIVESVRSLQQEYTEAQREAALRTVFTIDSQLLADGTYFVAMAADVLAGCGGWSFRKTLYGGDQQVERVQAEVLDPLVDAAKIRAIFVHPSFARRGVGGLLLKAAEDAARAGGFGRAEMGSTLTGIALYSREGYRRMESVQVPVGDGLAIEIVRMEKRL
jgi:GNAT superfamily N-acetyltransferase